MMSEIKEVVVLLFPAIVDYPNWHDLISLLPYLVRTDWQVSKIPIAPFMYIRMVLFKNHYYY